MIVTICGLFGLMATHGPMSAVAQELFNRPSGSEAPDKDDGLPPVFNSQGTKEGYSTSNLKKKKKMAAYNRVMTHDTIKMRELKHSAAMDMVTDQVREIRKERTQTLLEREFKAKVASLKKLQEGFQKTQRQKEQRQAEYLAKVKLYKEQDKKPPVSIGDYMQNAEAEIAKVKKQKNQEAGRKIFDVD